MPRTIEGEGTPTDMRHLIESAAANTKRLGFDLTQHATTVALVATEVVEALDCLHEGTGTDPELIAFAMGLKGYASRFEAYRRTAQNHQDGSYIADREHYFKELSDIVLRVFSYVGANGWTEEFIIALVDKMRENAKRPRLHQKGF